MSKSPPIPTAQQSKRGGDHAHLTQESLGRHDAKTGLQSEEPGDGDVNLDEQGRQANLRQNLPQHRGR